MKKTLELTNVAIAESTIVTVYPQWSDYGCLANALKVVYKDDEGKYIEKTLVTEDVDAYIDYYDVKIISTISPNEYLQMKKSERIGQPGCYAKPGDIIEVIKGRKFPIGSKFTVKKSYEFKDNYGRTQAMYWITEEGPMIKMSIVIISEKYE